MSATPAVDTGVPLCSAAALTGGGFAELARSFSQTYMADVMLEATRACETEADRRFAPFTVTESHRADGVDPDEVPSSIAAGLEAGAAGAVSYANAIGGAGTPRKVWLHEYAARFPEMWTYSAVAVSVLGSAGDLQQGVAALSGPDPGTGMLWLPIGAYTPTGSQITITYTGGYSTVPADLARAVKYMAASILVRELDPTDNGHNPGDLEALAVASLQPYRRA